MENIKYLNENELQRIADICEFYLNKDVKKTLKRIEAKNNVQFTLDRKTNVNLLWQAYSQEITTDLHKDIRYNKTYAEAFKQSNTINIEARDILSTYIKLNHQEDYTFIWEFNINSIVRDINLSLATAGFYYYSDSLKELLSTNDYYAFFNSLYGIGAVNGKAMKATKQAIKAFDELLNGIENKAGFFNALAQYYLNNDLSQFHNNIHST